MLLAKKKLIIKADISELLESILKKVNIANLTNRIQTRLVDKYEKQYIRTQNNLKKKKGGM